MMMACGHVIAKDSLTKLSKTGGWVSELLLTMFTDGHLVLEGVSSVHIVQQSHRLQQL